MRVTSWNRGPWILGIQTSNWRTLCSYHGSALLELQLAIW